MSAWVTDVPSMNGRSTPLQYRFLVAMQGALGIGANLNHWTDADQSLATKMIATYKRIRPTIQTGNLYRLISPTSNNDLASTEYVSQDGRQAVVFAFRHSQQYNTTVPPLPLRGLNPNATYTLESVDNKLQDQQTALSGAYLMSHGVTLNLRGDYDSTAVILQRQQ